MERPRPLGSAIDTQVIRDHGVEAEALDKAIRAIQLDALKQQHRLSVEHPMPGPRRPHWWRRGA